ncbi:MAG: NADPH-dependent assimilatory sulfite reductase hemoprotein subunit [Burkholderiaceae bacterium]|jgi:sulfite reductase (NADPH) hemoprotein beta-component|nr:NADPH-dependent assimilatory sulfite reductase hemoprotein subunit [Gemmatimonadales bacterium]MCO5118759.1 NADPH-dependent assimilatory sulfite reductase hemoprotein subunit [Burkholderiaceae bacterium]MEB2319948.1 NADPH-dependent assimilatory sulfite reductase hemoprotein subunit [Pseudomonadota bacterium]
MTEQAAPASLSEVEHIKAESRYLRGTLDLGLADRRTGSISESDDRVLKFHGSYQQDNRDVRDERRRQKLEPDYGFMVRVRLPGGVLTPRQWLDLDELASRYASSGLRITTRQTFQYHGARKEDLRDLIGGINATGLSTLAACGDVVRNVVCSVNPPHCTAHAEVQQWTVRLMYHLEPRTTAYRELWIDRRERLGDGANDDEPLLGRTYLPRKFKFGIAIPPYNDVDVFAQDFGLIAVLGEDGALQGFNLAPGGGMGATAGDPRTYPALADLIGFVPPEHLLETCWHAVAVQRDFGDRAIRKHARLKYTIDDRGLQWYRDELQSRLPFPIEPPRPYRFEHNGDRYGWVESDDGRWHLTLQIPSGRLEDVDGHLRRSGMREIARIHKGEFRMTCNQNVIVANVAAGDRKMIDALVGQYGLDDHRRASGLRLHALSCVALPTCGLAMAESERYLPQLLGRLEGLLERHGLRDEPIHLRMSGCPNGCSRPYMGEIGLVGRAVGKYDLHVGADHTGERLGAPYRENIGEEAIVSALDELLGRFAVERNPGERFGDFVVRAGIVEPPGRRPAIRY